MMEKNANPAQPKAAPPVLWKAYLAFLVPMIISNILQALSGTVNNIYLGQMLGVKAMAAVSAFFPVLFFLIAFMIGLGSGASVLIGQAWGAKNPERVRAITGTTLMVGIYFGLVVARRRCLCPHQHDRCTGHLCLPAHYFHDARRR